MKNGSKSSNDAGVFCSVVVGLLVFRSHGHQFTAMKSNINYKNKHYSVNGFQIWVLFCMIGNESGELGNWEIITASSSRTDEN